MFSLKHFLTWIFLSVFLTSCSIPDLFTREGVESHSGPAPLILPNYTDSSTVLPEFGSQSLFAPEHFVLDYKAVAEVITVEEEGQASWYGPNFHGNLTANGERYDMHELTAAHPSLPFNTRLWVENKANGQAVMVRINDRGPYANNRILDLSREAAQKLGMINKGTADVRLYRIKKENNSSSAMNEPFTIELGIFERGKEAFAYASELPDARVEIIQAKRGMQYGVFYGLFGDRDDAFIMQRKLDQKNIDGLVRRRSSS